MAETGGQGQGGSGRRRAPAKAPREDSGKRVILKRERVLLIPDSIPNEAIAGAQNVLRDAEAKATGKDAGEKTALATEAWHAVACEEGNTDTKAIEGYAGVPGTPDAKPGVYKGVPLTNWKGGAVYEKPSEPKVERRALDD